MALQLGGWIGTVSAARSVETQALFGVEVPLAHDLGILGFFGIQRHADGTLDARDAVLAVAWVPVARDWLVVRVQPGINLPTGGIGSGLYFTPLSTASFDPFVMGDVVVGRTWLGGLSAVARVPVYAGWDEIRQGPFFRMDLRVARRMGDLVPFVGVSGVRQLASDPRGAAPDFTELAATAGAVANLSPRWSLSGQARATLVASEGTERQVSGGLNLRVVVGRANDHHDHEEGDGHAHGETETP